MAKAALDLAEVELKDILQELERRLECATKEEKRLVLLGARPGNSSATKLSYQCKVYDFVVPHIS